MIIFVRLNIVVYINISLKVPVKNQNQCYQICQYFVHYNVSQNRFYSIQPELQKAYTPLELHLYAKSVPLVRFVQQIKTSMI